MNSRDISSGAEFASDSMYQAAEDAAYAVEKANTEARYDTTRGEVLDYMTMHMTRDDDKAFMRALRQEDRQSIAVMIELIHAAFRAVVAEKRAAILAKTPEPHE